MRKKVYLYIVRKNDVLVLRHIDFPDLGLQIPGGTVENHEAPVDAAAREAFEETGLTGLGTPSLLGITVLSSQRAGENLLEAWFYRLESAGPVPERWLHNEHDASDVCETVRFELFWMPKSAAADCLGSSDGIMLDVV